MQRPLCKSIKHLMTTNGSSQPLHQPASLPTPPTPPSTLPNTADLAAICQEIEERTACLNAIFPSLFPKMHCQTLPNGAAAIRPAAAMQQPIMMTATTPPPTMPQMQSPRTICSNNMTPLPDTRCKALPQPIQLTKMLMLQMLMTTTTMMLPTSMTPVPTLATTSINTSSIAATFL